jgi:hypothetical protein
MCQDLLLLGKCLLLATVKYTYCPSLFTVFGTTLDVFRPTVFSENVMVFHFSKPSYCNVEC